MKKRKDCKVCGEYSAKSGTCKNCKEKFPFKSAGSDGEPFNRNKEFKKSKKNERRNI